MFHLADDFGLKRNAHELPAVLQHPSASGFEQFCQSLPVDRLLEKKGGPRCKSLLHNFRIIMTGDDYDRGGPVPGRFSNLSSQFKTIHSRHLEVNENSVESLLVHQSGRLLAVTEGAHLDL